MSWVSFRSKCTFHHKKRHYYDIVKEQLRSLKKKKTRKRRLIRLSFSATCVSYLRSPAELHQLKDLHYPIFQSVSDLQQPVERQRRASHGSTGCYITTMSLYSCSDVADSRWSKQHGQRHLTYLGGSSVRVYPQVREDWKQGRQDW